MGSVAQNVIRQDFGFPWIVRTDTELRKLGHDVRGGFNRRQRRVRGSRIEDARSGEAGQDDEAPSTSLSSASLLLVGDWASPSRSICAKTMPAF
jgi:hypothetical protein